MTYTAGDRVTHKGSGETGTLVKRIDYFDADECDWTVEVNTQSRTSWCERDLAHIDSPETELQPGDRVKHETLGEGRLSKASGADDNWPINRVAGVAIVMFDSGKDEWIALNLLTEVEPSAPQESQPLLIHLLRRASQGAMVDEDTGHQMYDVDVDAALRVFGEHFDSKCDEVADQILDLCQQWKRLQVAPISSPVPEPVAHVVTRLRSILIGNES